MPVIKAIEEVRNSCNKPWKRNLLFQNKISWNKLWTSIDVLDDTEQAIKTYKGSDDFKHPENGYLFLYGLLQALYLQQDSINSLSVSLFSKEIDWKNNFPDLYLIREIRNNSIGHPTNRRNDKSFHQIIRNTIKKESFEIISSYPKTGDPTKFEEINVLESIDTQAELVSLILKETMGKLKEEFEIHRKKFEKKMINLIPKTLDYHFSKLSSSDASIVKINFDVISKLYFSLKAEVIKRFYSISALSGLEYTCQRIEYILTRLQRDLIEDPIEDEMELEIFIKSLNQNFDDFKGMIIEIDEEFS